MPLAFYKQRSGNSAIVYPHLRSTQTLWGLQHRRFFFYCFFFGIALWARGFPRGSLGQVLVFIFLWRSPYSNPRHMESSFWEPVFSHQAMSSISNFLLFPYTLVLKNSVLCLMTLQTQFLMLTSLCNIRVQCCFSNIQKRVKDYLKRLA